MEAAIICGGVCLLVLGWALGYISVKYMNRKKLELSSDGTIFLDYGDGEGTPELYLHLHKEIDDIRKRRFVTIRISEVTDKPQE